MNNHREQNLLPQIDRWGGGGLEKCVMFPNDPFSPAAAEKNAGYSRQLSKQLFIHS
jgi:hypothetical protein